MTIIKTGSTSLNVVVIYRRLTELMITPVRERRDAFINTGGFHRGRGVFRDTEKSVEISPGREPISSYSGCLLPAKYFETRGNTLCVGTFLTAFQSISQFTRIGREFWKASCQSYRAVNGS